MDIILTKVRNETKFHKQFFPHAYIVHFQLVHWAHLSVISLQCPTKYQEEMGINVEISRVDQNAPPTKRVLVKLHEKVINSF